MSVLSKFFGDWLGFKIVTTNCYETVHTWEPDCTEAIKQAVPGGFRFCLRTYATFYILAELASARGDPRRMRIARLVPAILRSSAFLTTNLILYLWFMCRFRHALGFWIWPTLGLTNGILSSFFAILVEKPSRRPALALYLTNLTSETMFRQAVNHGYLRKIPNGQWIVFSAGLALLFYLRSRGKLDKSTDGILRKTHETTTLPEWMYARLPCRVKAVIDNLRKGDRTLQCDHSYSCASTACEGFTRNFTIGLGVSGALTLLKNLRTIFKSPSKVANALFSRDNLRIPLFLGLMPLLYNVTRCTLNRVTPTKRTLVETLAGAASGVSMAVFPNVSIAMYILWKAIESWYRDLVSRGILPTIPYGDILLYTLSTGYVLFAAVIEPQSMRYGYYKFLSGLTGERIAIFNRTLFDELGFHSSRMFPGFQPTINCKHATINPMLYQPVPRP